MNSISVVATTLEQLRLSTSNPAWVILRAKNAPAVLAILRSVFEGDNRQVAGSDFALAVDAMLVDIREQTDMELPKTVMSIEFLDKESNDFLDTESMEFLDSF
ncbi:hypothetical protein CKJ80_10210 [Corynebacterium hadale]|uniref:Fe-S cluster assembly protein HesB n=1 Tax=Corynebacterium hadale TaxID=2026255 RepID=A0AB36RHM4_9CORY|nr:DUF3375 family protein [Corynebacterium hadale]PAT09623.1 hypothetical protein CKJ80_10210 [Corynebacterium hadale]